MRDRLGSIVVAIVLAAIWSAPAAAQTPQPAGASNRLAWDQGAPDLATANAYSYIVTIDTAPPTIAGGVVCTGTATPFACVAAPFPALANLSGVHSLTMIATNAAGESSLPSTPFAFLVMVVPATPKNLRIIK